MEKSNLDVTVFQDAKGQGKGAVETAVKLIKGEQVESFVWIPFELVTSEKLQGIPQEVMLMLACAVVRRPRRSLCLLDTAPMG